MLSRYCFIPVILPTLRRPGPVWAGLSPSTRTHAAPFDRSRRKLEGQASLPNEGGQANSLAIGMFRCVACGRGFAWEAGRLAARSGYDSLDQLAGRSPVLLNRLSPAIRFPVHYAACCHRFAKIIR